MLSHTRFALCQINSTYIKKIKCRFPNIEIGSLWTSLSAVECSFLHGMCWFSAFPTHVSYFSFLFSYWGPLGPQ